MKTCTKCGELKESSEFNKHSQMKDGLRPDCKECDNKRNNKWRKDNHLRKLLNDRKYRENHLEYCREKGKIRYWSKVDHNRMRHRIWLQNNPNHTKDYYLSTINWTKKQKRNYSKTEQGRFHNRLRVQRRRARFNEVLNTLTADEWRNIVTNLYGFKCCYCGKELDWSTVTQDHKVPIYLGGEHTKDNVVPSCKSCNAKKSIKTDTEFLEGSCNI